MNSNDRDFRYMCMICTFTWTIQQGGKKAGKKPRSAMQQQQPPPPPPPPLSLPKSKYVLTSCDPTPELRPMTCQNRKHRPYQEQGVLTKTGCHTCEEKVVCCHSRRLDDPAKARSLRVRRKEEKKVSSENSPIFTVRQCPVLCTFATHYAK